MKEKKDKYLARMTIYNFDKNKIKMDYSIIKVSMIEKTKEKCIFQSSSSDEKIEIRKDLKPEFYSKNKTSRVFKVFEFNSDESLENIEPIINRDIYKLFIKRFWFKFKHKKFLKKKISLGQFVI